MEAPFYEKFKKSDSKKTEQKKAEKKNKFNETKIHNNLQKNKNKTAGKKISIEKKQLYVDSINYLFDSASIPKDAQEIINGFDKITESTHPLNSKQKQLLPKQINELSHHLTDERSKRHLSYMNSPVTQTAYIHYFTWWNLVRLTKVFANLSQSFFNLNDGDICLDIGSGPLTVVTALFLSRPELRKKRLTWYCMDISMQALSIGENIFLSVAAKLQCEPWKIVRVKGAEGTSIKDKVSFISCANVFNEMNEKPGTPPDFLAKKYSDSLMHYLDLQKNAKILVVEPGIPKSARLISLMRDAFIRKGFTVSSPCCHQNTCPMDGKKGGKWCNLSFSTDDAPKALKALSEKAELPKERAVLSFIAAEKNPNKINADFADDADDGILKFTVNSDAIKLPGARTGFYACSKIGLLLVVTNSLLKSGQTFSVKTEYKNLSVDKKSGALILNLA